MTGRTKTVLALLALTSMLWIGSIGYAQPSTERRDSPSGMPAPIGQEIQRLDSRQAVERADAAWALGERGDFRAVDPLIAALEDEDRDVKRNAAEALRKITGKDFGEDPDKWREWWEEDVEADLECCP